MAKYLLLNNVTGSDSAVTKAGKILDDQIDDIAKIRATGGVVVTLPNPVLEARAAAVREQQSRGRRGAELDELTAGSAESVDISGIPLATPVSAGLMSGPDKATLDALGFGVVLTQVRNQTGSTLMKGQLVAVSGYSVPFGVPLVALADKDTPSLRPAIGFIQTDLPDSTTGFVITNGVLKGLDTSMFALTDQLVLGNTGAFSRPPPDQDPFTGEVQNVASITRVHATLGEIIVETDGLLPVPAEQFFALNGVPGYAFPFGAVQGALANATSDVSFNNRKILDVANPTNPQEVATKAYADAVATGLTVKQAVRVIATTLIVLSGTQTIDGVAVIALDRVLVAGQGGTTATPDVANGIYIVHAGAWTRATDMAAGSSASGSFVFISQGSSFGSTGWVCATTAPNDVVGTNPIVFSQFSGIGTINAGDGLVKTGNTIDAVANADGSIVVNPNDIQVGVLATDAQHGSRGGGAQHPVATVVIAGFMSSSDKTKLDGVEIGATNTPLSSTAPADVTKAAAAVGVGTTAARADHKHDITTAAASTIQPDDASAEGTATSLSRSDHKHAIAADVAGTISVGDVPAEGASTSFARANHVHGLTAPAAPVNVTKAAASAGAATTVARSDHKHDVTTAAPGTIQPDDASAEGTATSLSRSDHKHAIVAEAPGAILIGDAASEGVATSFSRSDHTHSLAAPASPADVTKAAANAGASTSTARADHKHDVSTAVPGTVTFGAAAEGTATSLARSDHVHALTAPAAPANVTKAAASAGTSANVAREDHKHDVTTAAPGATGVATASAEGTATSLARSDHAHQSNTAPVNVTKAAAAIGTSGEPARADHKHDVSTAVVGAINVGDAAAEGTATTLTRSDHVHSLAAPAAPANVDKSAASAGASSNVARQDHKHDISTAAPAATGVSTASADGAATTLARSDHSHQSNTAPANVTKAAAAIGTSGEPARADHKHDVTTAAPGATGVATASAEGTATSLARSDHAHQSNTAPVNVTKAAAAIGTSAEPARADHKHDVTTAVVVSIGSANAEGTATSLARSDHVHLGPSAQLSWGNDSVAATTTTRYLTPCYEAETARTGPVQFKVTRAGTLKNMRVHANTTAGNGNAIVYTLRVNGVASTLTVSLASTTADGSDLTHSVVVAAGDSVDIEVTKAASVATSPSDITVTMEFAA